MSIKHLLIGSLALLPFATQAQAPARHGIDRANMDFSAAPGDDFYQYACGGWMKANPLTGEYSRFGVFDLMRENNRTRLKELITTLSKDSQSKVPGTIAQKVSDIYALGMDSARLNREGAAPILPYISKVKAFSRQDLAHNLATLHRGIADGTLFGAGVGTNPLNSEINILHLGETGLGLGDRDYYLEDNETNARIMAAYQTYVKRLMELVGYDAAAQQRVWDNVIGMEKAFAQAKMAREQRRNPKLRSNPMSLDQVKQRWPNFDWQTYLGDLGLLTDSLNVSSPAFFDALNEMLPKLTDQQLEDYFVFNMVTDGTGVLSDDFYNASFELYDRVMSGTEEQEPRWKRAMAIPNSMLGEAVGELYVNKYFPRENKEYMVGLVENLRTALGQHIDDLRWMSDETKRRAHEKLARFTVKIGYPDKWKDYSGITIDPSKSYFDNVLAASEWYVQDNYNKLNKPVDKTEWHMTPQTVNAYYNPTTNEICFPAGILQAPYFDPRADDALNYGAIGVVIGHEMTHGFDDSGRQYDADGNLRDWWTDADAKAFTKLADGLAAQFDAVEVAPGVHANGRFTLGENIADQGGLRVALTAYKNAARGKAWEEIDGLDPLQRFYLSYAQVWANNIRPEEILVRTKTDPHSLGNNRVNVTLRNIAPFFEAFHINEGQPMFRPVSERVIIW